jgi:hypothetical protein
LKKHHGNAIGFFMVEVILGVVAAAIPVESIPKHEVRGSGLTAFPMR